MTWEKEWRKTGIESDHIRRWVQVKELRTGFAKERHQNKEKLGVRKESAQFDLVMVALGQVWYFRNKAVKAG